MRHPILHLVGCSVGSIVGPVVGPLVLAGLLLSSLGCSPSPPHLDNPGQTIVCFGDSITAGVGAAAGSSYPDVLTRELGIEVINLGVSGDTAAEGRSRSSEIFNYDPWLVIIGLGGNDFLRRVPPEETDKALRDLVQEVLDAGKTPLLLELDVPFAGDLLQLQRRVAKDLGVPVLRGVLGDILRDPGLKSDMIHPNTEGYRVLGEAVAEEVRPWLDERRRQGR